jgi:hypothetical protein
MWPEAISSLLHILGQIFGFCKIDPSFCPEGFDELLLFGTRI